MLLSICETLILNGVAVAVEWNNWSAAASRSRTESAQKTAHSTSGCGHCAPKMESVARALSAFVSLKTAAEIALQNGGESFSAVSAQKPPVVVRYSLLSPSKQLNIPYRLCFQPISDLLTRRRVSHFKLGAIQDSLCNSQHKCINSVR